MNLSTERANEWIRHAAAAGVYFLTLVACYINMGQDMGAEYFLPAFVPFLAVLMLVQYGTGVSLFSRGMIGAMVPGVLWCVTFPLLYAWTYQQPWYSSLIYYDFLIGTANMLVLAALGGVLFHLGHRRLTAALLWVVSNALQWAVVLVVQVLIALIVPAAVIGARLADTDLLTHPERHHRLLISVGLGGLVLGALAAFHGALTLATTVQLWPWDFAMTEFFGLAGACGWLALLALYAGGPRPDGRLTGLRRLASAVGRRSMTVYLSQTILFGIIFGVVPLLVTGRRLWMGQAAAALVALGVWLASVVLCAALERGGHAGPFETLLRTAVACSERRTGTGRSEIDQTRSTKSGPGRDSIPESTVAHLCPNKNSASLPKSFSIFSSSLAITLPPSIHRQHRSRPTLPTLPQAALRASREGRAPNTILSYLPLQRYHRTCAESRRIHAKIPRASHTIRSPEATKALPISSATDTPPTNGEASIREAQTTSRRPFRSIAHHFPNPRDFRRKEVAMRTTPVKENQHATMMGIMKAVTPRRISMTMPIRRSSTP